MTNSNGPALGAATAQNEACSVADGAANTFSRDDLVAGLHARGVCYLTPSPSGDEKALGDSELIAGIAAAEDARLRFALAGLFLVRPDLAACAVGVDATLRGAARDELRKQYVAAMYLQRLWRTHLRLQFGDTPLIPEHFTSELGLPGPEQMHGELGLRMLCERSPYNDWSSYQQVVDLIGSQPCSSGDVIPLKASDEGDQSNPGRQ
ncbi:MAG: hypothetical protein M1434_08650 [Chloroflexi bacterium]|nr:hypothetical protein [Chloroflexota bacterium]MCL5274798.1 hypothetical protein [Chloroflexota bacterium]